MTSNRKNKNKLEHRSAGFSEKKINSNEKLNSEKESLSHSVKKVKESLMNFGKSPRTTKIFNYSKMILPYFLLLCIVFLAGYIRATPAWLPATEEWARSSLDDQLRAQISAGIDQQYPNLPPENRNRLINEQLNEFKRQNRDQYEAQIDEISRYFKSRLQTEGGQTYLTGIDPYFWYRYARNLIETGIPGDEVRDGIQWDSLMNAPHGRSAPLESHVWVIAWFHQVFSFFNSNVELMTSAFYVTVIITPLAVIPAFFIAKKFAGVIAGLIAAFIMAVHPAFLTRTMGGFSDTDPYNIIFPLFVTWFVIEALSSKKFWQAFTYTSLAIASMFLFAMSWQGWWYIFLIVCGALGVYLVWLIAINTVKKQKPFFEAFSGKDTRQKLFVLGFFFVGSLFFTGLLDNFRSVVRIFYELPMSVVRIREIAQTRIWPNVLTTVAELNPSTNSQIVSSMGGTLIFTIAFLGALMTLMVKGKKHILKEFSYIGVSFMFYLFVLRDPNAMRDVVFAALLVLPIVGKVIFNLAMYKADDLKSVSIVYAGIIAVWMASTVFATTRGVRFTMMIVPPLALGVGIFAGVTYFSLRDVSVKYVGLGKKISAPLVAILILWLFMLGPLSGSVYARGHATAVNHIPSMNDAWYITLSQIRDNSAEDAIIFSWWDFGHWFKAIAERRVFFDGASQGEFPAHWTGKALLTQDETLSLGAIRMMACGRQNSYQTLLNYSPSTLDAVELLYDIIVLNRSDAEELLLSRDVPRDIVDEVLDYTHCIPPEVYYITSEDMVGKGGVWGHFGSWDFQRAEKFRLVNRVTNYSEGVRILVENFSYSESEAQRLYSEIISADPSRWIAPWPGFLSGGTLCSGRQEDLFLCRVRIQEGELNVLFNSTSGDASVVAAQNQVVYPHSISYVDNEGRFIHKGYNEYQVPYAFSFAREGNNFRIILLDPLQASSMFTRLFFHNGAGVSHLRPFYDIRGITGGRILTWKIDWYSFLESIGDLTSEEAQELREASALHTQQAGQEGLDETFELIDLDFEELEDLSEINELEDDGLGVFISTE